MPLPNIMTVPNPADASDLTDIVNAIKYIRNELINANVSVPTLEAPTFVLSEQYRNIATKYQAIENDLAIINDNEYQSAFFIKKITRGYYEPSRAEWQRWIDILVDMDEILTGQVGKWQYLKLTDGYLTINNQKILLRGEMING